MGLIVNKVLNGKLLEWTYFVHNEGDNKCIVIDPGYELEPIMEYLETNKLEVSDILITHCHFDHMLSTKDLVEKYGAKVYATKEDEKLIDDFQNNYAIMIGCHESAGFKIDKYVDDDEIIEILGIKIKCIWTPGHTKGEVSFLFIDDKILFSGDTLFRMTYGKTTFFTGSMEDMKNSILNKLFLLDDDIKVYPGHGEDTDIAHEKKYNMIKRD